MYRVYCTAEPPIFLDATACDLLLEARANFVRYNLQKTSILAHGNQTLLFCWMGDVVLDTILVQLVSRGLKVQKDSMVIVVDGLTTKEIILHLTGIANTEPIDTIKLDLKVINKIDEKYDIFLNEELLSASYAAYYFNIQAAWEAVRQAISRAKPCCA